MIGDENMKNSLQQVADGKNSKYQYFLDKADELFFQNKLNEALIILDAIHEIVNDWCSGR